MSAGLGCGLGCTLALSVTHSAIAAAVCGFWRYINAMPLPIPFCLHSVGKRGGSIPITAMYEREKEREREQTVWARQRLEVSTLPRAAELLGAGNVVVSEEMELGRHAIGQNARHHHTRIFALRHARGLTKLALQERFQRLRTVRPLAAEHLVFQLEIQPETLLRRLPCKNALIRTAAAQAYWRVIGKKR